MVGSTCEEQQLRKLLVYPCVLPCLRSKGTAGFGCLEKFGPGSFLSTPPEPWGDGGHGHRGRWGHGRTNGTNGSEIRGSTRSEQTPKSSPALPRIKPSCSQALAAFPCQHCLSCPRVQLLQGRDCTRTPLRRGAEQVWGHSSGTFEPPSSWEGILYNPGRDGHGNV